MLEGLRKGAPSRDQNIWREGGLLGRSWELEPGTYRIEMIKVTNNTNLRSIRLVRPGSNKLTRYSLNPV